MSCLSDNTLFELSVGQLAGAALQAAEQHVDGCATCRRALAETLRTSAPRPRQPPPPVSAGTSVGRYIVIERVGAGAMGQVFSAYDPQLDRKVALKLLRPGASTDEHRARMGREAQTLARLSHPNVVTVFDLGSWQGQLFMALEFVPGGSARAWRSTRPHGWREVVALYAQAGRGLAAAHEAGVVHRDFKPDNVLVRADGRAQVTDFGLAATNLSPGVSGEGRGLDLTHSDVLLGTPAYMPADQLEGAAATPSSDQFSFCAALFEALSGERPFEGQTVGELVANQRAGRVKSLEKAAPPSVRRVILRGLLPNAQARFPSMKALVDALDAATSRSRLGLVGVGAVAALGLSVFALSPASGVKRQPACALAESRQLTTWSEERRAALGKTFEATGLSYADRAFALVDLAVRRRADAWRPSRTEACEAVLSGGTAPLFRAQLQCLDERWAELEATLGVLETGGNEVVERAVRIIERLPGPEVCAQPATLARYGADAGHCERCVEDQAVVARTRSLFEAGKFVAAGEVASLGLDGGVATAQALAALGFEQGRILEEVGKLDAAEVAFFAAGLDGQRAGDGVLAAASWAELGYLVGYLRERTEEGERWVEQGEALAALERDHRLAERFASVRGVIAARRGKLELAERYFAEAEQLARTQRGPSHPMRARALSNLGNVQLHQGRVAEALPKLEEAWRLLAAAEGEEHPDAFQAMNSYGAALGGAGRFEDAVPIFERALAGYQKTLGADHPRIGTAALNLAEAERRLDRLDPALAHYTLAAEVWKKAGTAGRALALAGQAEVLLEQKKAGQALPLLQEGVAICERQECEPIDEGQVRYFLARALREVGRPASEATAQAKRALAVLEPLGAEGEELVAQLKTFLR